MKQIKASFIYGLIAIIPIIAIGVLALLILDLLSAAMDYLQVDSHVTAILIFLVALLGALLAILALGSVVRTRLGTVTFEVLEKKLLTQIPGYRIISGVLKGFVENRSDYKPVLVSLYQPGTAVLGFLMEENDNGTLTVFVPATPAVTVGSLHVVDRTLVKLLDASQVDTLNCFADWGMGSSKVIGDSVLPKPVEPS
ncbi:MAG: DUF502 domain-containing protein [bacterium]